MRSSNLANDNFQGKKIDLLKTMLELNSTANCSLMVHNYLLL